MSRSFSQLPRTPARPPVHRRRSSKAPGGGRVQVSGQVGGYAWCPDQPAVNLEPAPYRRQEARTEAACPRPAEPLQPRQHQGLRRLGYLPALGPQRQLHDCRQVAAVMQPSAGPPWSGGTSAMHGDGRAAGPGHGVLACDCRRARLCWRVKLRVGRAREHGDLLPLVETVRRWWFEADAWCDPAAQQQYLARVDGYRTHGPPPVGQRTTRQEVRSRYGI
jgi:hypothetical protein